MSDSLLDSCYAGIAPFVRFFTEGSDGAHVVEPAGGVTASVIPASPERSLFNTVVFDRARPAELAAALPQLEAAYAAAGVNAWSVWVVEGDAEAERIVQQSGFTHDSQPRAMGAPLAEIDGSIDTSGVEQRWDMAALARVNERAYGLPAGQFGAVLEPIAEREGVRCFIAEDEGEPAATVITLLTEQGDCTVYFVATDPDRQRRGHSLRTMAAALAAARADGAETTTLQATKHGAPLYLRLGYRDLGVAVNLWEKRRAA